MWKKLGALSIGYSPRPGIVDDIISCRPQIEIVHAGALDGVAVGDIASLQLVETVAPDGSREIVSSYNSTAEYQLITMLNPNQVVSLEKHDLLPLLQNKINELCKTDIDAILLLCTGRFPGLVSSKPLVIPHEVFAKAISWLRPKAKVAVVCPIEGQKKAAEGKWQLEGFDPVVLVASPYTDRDIEKTGQMLQKERFELVILDCFGFGETTKKGLAKFVKCPVISIRIVVRSLLLEFFG
jgi:protein AroM